MDTVDYRSEMLEPLAQYHHGGHLHGGSGGGGGGGSGGRLSPSPTGGYYCPSTNGTYATLQPLPPIGTVSDKFVNGGFGFEMDSPYGPGIYKYDKLSAMHPVHHHHPHSHHQIMSGGSGAGSGFIGAGNATPSSSMASHNGYSHPQGIGGYPGGAGTPGVGYPPGHCGLLPPSSHKQESKLMALHHQGSVYDHYSSAPASAGAHLLQMTGPVATPFNGHMFSIHGSPPSRSAGAASHPLMGSLRADHRCVTADVRGSGLTVKSHSDLEEINTKDLAQKISSELKRYSIPQAVFAQRVLCRSQGTLSDLLRNPKPWSKLKSGRETFRRMWKWLQEPEFQRMSALRLAGKITGTYTNLRTSSVPSFISFNLLPEVEMVSHDRKEISGDLR